MHCRFRTVLSFAVIITALAGCAPPSLTARAPTFESAHLDQAIIVLSFAGGSDAGLLGNESNPDLREQLRTRIGQELIRQAAYFGVGLAEPPEREVEPDALQAAVESYSDLRAEAKDAIRRSAPLTTPAPPALLALSEAVGAQRSIILYTTGWRMTTGNRVLSAFALSAEPRSGIGIEATIFDTKSAQVEWFGQHYADMDPAKPEEVEALTAAFVFELFTGRRVSAFSFLPWPEGMSVTVWPHDGKRIPGHIVHRDGFDLVLRDDDTERRIPLAKVSSIQTASGHRIFPSPRRSSSRQTTF
jgi:hypothetical protein